MKSSSITCNEKMPVLKATISHTVYYIECSVTVVLII